MAARTRYRTSSRTRSISRRASLGTLYPHRLAFECLEDRRLLSCTVGDWVWKDANNNGIQDTGEPGVAGAAVELFSAAGVSQKTTITDANGLYSFSDLTAGASYYLVFHAPVGYSFALQDQGSDNADSDVAPSGDQAGSTATFTLSSGENRTDLDAGLTGDVPGFGYALNVGAGSDDVGKAVATDASGNVYVTGSFQGTADFDSGPGVCNLISAGGNDIFVAKYSPTGALVWARRMGGAGGEDYGIAIAVATDGNIYTTGRFQGTVDFNPGTGTSNLTSNGSTDVFVSNLDAAGNFVWARRMGGSSTDYGNGIAVGIDGSVYTTGYFGGTAGASASFGTTNLTSAGVQDVFVCKLGSDGNFLWASRAGGANADAGYGIAVATDGSVYVSGYFGNTSGGTADFGTTTLTSAGGQDIFVSKLDSTGSFVWAQRMGGTANDADYGIALATDGSVYTIGSFQSTADFGPTNLTGAGGNDVFVSKLNSLGSVVWAQRAGTSGSDIGYGVALGNDGVYATGYFSGTSDFDPSSSGTANLTSAGAQDIFVWKLNSAGGFVSACRMGGSTADFGYGIALASDGNVYTTGYFTGDGDFDPGVATYNLTSAGGNDLFVAKLTADQPPEDILLSATSVAENLPAGTVVATLTSADADLPNETFTYSLVSGAGDSDNASFAVVGDQLRTVTSFDYEFKSSYTIRLRTTDSGGRWYEKQFTISVTDVNETSWVGGTAGYWDVASNWSGGAVPTSADDVTISPASPATVTIRSGATAAANSVVVGDENWLHITGGSLTTAAGLTNDGIITIEPGCSVTVGGSCIESAGAVLSMPGGGDPTYPATNWLTNSGFESPVVANGSTTTRPANWNYTGAAYLSTQYAYTGAQSVVMSAAVSNSSAYKTFTATPGTSYALSAYAMTPASDPLRGNHYVELRIFFLDSGGATLSVDQERIVNYMSAAGGPLQGSVGDQGWSRYWTSAVAPEGTASVKAVVTVICAPGSSGDGVAYFDDVTFGPVPRSELVVASISNSGTITVGPANTITATGTFVQTSTGTLGLELGGATASDTFGRPSPGIFGSVAAGAATLAGTLKADLAYGYTPSTTDAFTPITFASVSGAFDSYQLPSGIGYQFAGSVTFTNVVLSAFPTAELTATIHADDLLHPVAPNLLGAHQSPSDPNADSPQTEQMVTAAGLHSIHFPGLSVAVGSVSLGWHFNVDYTPQKPDFHSYGRLLKSIAAVGATGVVETQYRTGSPQEAAAQLAYTLGSPSDDTLLGNGIQWNDTTSQWEWVDWRAVGYWASLRAAAPLAEDDGLNFMRLDHPLPFSNVAYWEVGNEDWAPNSDDHHGTDMPDGTSTGLAHDPGTYALFAAQLAAYANEISTFAGLPAISIGINCTSTAVSYDDWLRGVLANGLDHGFVPGFLSDHSYVYSNEDGSDAFLLNHSVSDPGNIRDWTTRYNLYEALLQQTLSPEQAASVQILATEYNSNASLTTKQVTSLVEGLYIADSIGSLMDSGYQGACFYSLHSTLWTMGYVSNNSLYGWREGTGWGMLGDTNPDLSYNPNPGPPWTGPYVAYPGYFAMQLASKFAQSGGQVVSAASNYADLHVYAVQQASGHLSLLVINTNPAADLTMQFDLAGFQPSGAAEVWQYGKAEDTAQSQTTDGASALTNFSTTLSLSGSNFSYLFPAYSMTVLDLGRAVVTITANNADKTYGSADPMFSVSYVGFAPGDGPSNLGGTLAFTTNEPPTGYAPVGSYSITPSGLTSSNYAINFVPGTLSVTPAALTVTASAPASGPEGTAITVSGTATDPTDPEAAPSFAWSVTRNGGPYVTGSGASFTFTPDDQGTYLATLVATDIHLSSGSVVKTISVTDVPPTASVGGPITGPEGTAITLTGSASEPSSADAATLTYTWNVSNNGSFYIHGSGPNFTFAPNDQGTYVATLTASDKDGSATATQTISVTDVAPTAAIGGPATGPEGTPITLIGSVTEPSSADAATLSYAWNVNKNGSFYVHGSGPNFTFTPNDEGTYVATLTASDKDGSGTATRTISVTDVLPTASISGPASGNEGTPITLTGSASDPSTVDAAWGFTYTWNVTRNGNFYVRASGPNLAFTPNDQGNYLATLTALETNGTSGVATKTIGVIDVLPTAAIGGPTTDTEGTAITLTGSATDPSTVDMAASFSYRWNVTKDSNAYSMGSGGSFAFTPNDQGTYVATLIATGRDGSSPAATRTITVRNAAPIASIGKANNVNEGTPITLTGSAIDPSSADTATGLTYDWRVNKDGNFYIQGNGTSFTFTPTDQGSYLATLTATDKDHGSGTATRTLTVSNVAPTVTLSGPTTGEEGGPITLGSTVTDPSSDDTTRGFTYAWSVSRNGNFYMRATGSESFNFTPNDQGTYVATLTATDKDNGSRAGNRTIVVGSVAPAVTLSKPGAVNEGTAITLSGTVIDPSTADSAWGFTYAWNVTKNGSAYASGNDTSPTFTPDDNGTYTATLTATDKDGVSGTSAKTLTVGNVPPSVSINKPGTAAEGAPLTLSAVVIDPSSADTAVGFGYDWSVSKNGSFYRHGTDASLTFTPDDNGTYVATLIASDKDGYPSTTTRTFTVLNVGPTASLGNNGPVAAGSTAVVAFGGIFDPSSMDNTAGLRYAYDFDNNGVFEVGNGTYAGSVTVSSATVPAGLLATPGTRVVHARIIDKDDGHTDYTTSLTVGSPLLAQDVAPGGSTSIVGQAAAQSLLVAATARWSAAGVDVSVLRNVQVRVADLPGVVLGLASPLDHTIWLDVNAAGHGWFIDPTPQWDEEFVRQAAGDWFAQDARTLHGMDLLTVISHELGHLLGRPDLEPDASAANLMDATLGDGIRRLPTLDSSAASVGTRQFAIGTELLNGQLQARDDLFAGWDDGSDGLRLKHFRR